MLEEVPLPLNSELACGEPLPVCHHLLHSHLRVEPRDHVEVIGHKQKQWNVPLHTLNSERNAVCNFFRESRDAQCVSPPLLCADSHEDIGLWRDPLGRIVR